MSKCESSEGVKKVWLSWVEIDEAIKGVGLMRSGNS